MNIAQFGVIAFLPRKAGFYSLVYMIEKMMNVSRHPLNGFHLYDHEALAKKLAQLEIEEQKTILIGATFALLIVECIMPLKHTIVRPKPGHEG